MPDTLVNAVELHRGGELAGAKKLYQSLLTSDGENVEALHMLGVLLHQQGEHRQAIELIVRAVSLRPNDPAMHGNLAEAYRATGEFARAVGCCQLALSLQPEYPEAICNLGAALQGLKRHEEAIAEFERALALRPDFALAHNNLGISLRELGRLDDAQAHFERAVELAPTLAAGHSNLGQLLLQRGRPDEALHHCQEAARLQPAIAAVHHNLGNVLRTLERYTDARAAYLEALRLAPELAEAHAQIGKIFQRENQFAAALPWLRKAVELDPDNSAAWESLAEVHSELDAPAEAASCWRRVVALDRHRVRALLGLGWALQDDSRLSEAEEQYRVALDIDPENPGVHLNLGGLFEELGQLAEAEAEYRKAIELQPSFPQPHARLAMLLGARLPQSDQANVESWLQSTALDDSARARMLFALAHVHDARGEYARAAEYAGRAHDLSAATVKEHRKYNAVAHECLVDRFLATFDRAFLERAGGHGLDTQQPVFVFGLPRSGTTLVEQILASHSKIHGAGELRLARDTFESLPLALQRPGRPIDCAAAMAGPELADVARRHLDRLRALDPARSPRIVDKMPDNYLYCGLLAAMFPRATFIHCRRDLRDVATSCWLTDFRSITWAHDVHHIASRFRQYRRVMDHWTETATVPIHEVQYEELVSDLERVARQLIAACDLEWEPSCLEYYQTRRPVRTASLAQVRQPIYQRSVARWMNYQPILTDLYAVLASEPM